MQIIYISKFLYTFFRVDVHPTEGITVVHRPVQDHHVRDGEGVTLEVIRVMVVEKVIELVQGIKFVLRFDFALIHFLVAELTEPAGLVEMIPGGKPPSVTDDIGVLVVKLENLIFHSHFNF